ncbi:MAG TPA: hypothetical protein VMJ66_07855 [Geobacteraceae bacterium]|nr:hypothetical protein [Geobacteraceae bacterium]
MTFLLRLIPFLCALQLMLPHAAPAAPSLPRLAKPPLGERWFSISKEKEQTGFNRIDISEAPGGYEITVESGTKMTILGFARDAVSWEKYLVNPDLTLKSFEVDEVIDGKQIKLNGEVTAEGVRVNFTRDGKTKDKLLKVKGAVYPPPVVNMYPLLQGGEPGKTLKLKMLDIEAIKVIGIKMSVIGIETLPGGATVLHVQNDLYTFVDNDIWVDPSGNTLKESVRHGLIVTQAVDRESARKFISAHPGLKRR